MADRSAWKLPVTNGRMTESGLHGALAKGYVRASRGSKRLGLAHGAPQTRWLKSDTGMRSAVGSEVLAPWAIAVLCDAPARRRAGNPQFRRGRSIGRRLSLLNTLPTR